MMISTKFTAVECVSSKTSPGLATGFGTSSSLAFSIGPNSRTTTARIMFSEKNLRGCVFRLPANRLRRDAALHDPIHDIALAYLAVGSERDLGEPDEIFRHV